MVGLGGGVGVVDPLTCMSPSTGVKGGMAVRPFTCVSGGIRVNSSGMVVPGTDVVDNTHVNGKGAVCGKTMVTTAPRSFGCANSSAVTHVNGGGAVHRGTMVVHTAFTKSRAIMKDNGFVVRKTHVSRSIAVNGGYVVNGNSRISNYYMIRSCTVLASGMLVRKGAHLKACTTMRNKYHFAGSVPPCYITTRRPATFCDVGAAILRRRNFSRAIVGRVTRTFHVLCGIGASARSTLHHVRRRIPSDPRVMRLVRFIEDSGLNVVGWVCLYLPLYWR